MEHTPPPCPSGFVDLTTPSHWAEYWRRSPDGTALPASARLVGNWCRDEPPWQEGKHGYFMRKEGLFYKHPNGATYRASGVDEFPPV